MNMVPSSPRLDVVDSLRGFALLAIVLLHSLEQYNVLYFPEDLPLWLKSLDKGVFNAVFFLFAGKAYATFSLLFGFSFYIQLNNARKRGKNFRGRFAWRMFLLFLFSQFHAVFYNGDILLLYSVVGLGLILVCELKDRSVLILAVLCLLQPVEWVRVVKGVMEPGYETYGNYFRDYAAIVRPVMKEGNLWEMMCTNIWNGQLYSNLWQLENGRFFQTLSLFMFGMLLGRRQYFVQSKVSAHFWKKAFLAAMVCFIPLYVLQVSLDGLVANESVRTPLNIIVPSLANFCFMTILVSAFTLLWFKSDGYGFQKAIIPYGRMTLTNYICQSMIGVAVFYGFGLGLYQYAGSTYCLLIGIAIFMVQLYFSRWWLSGHRQGPLEILWKKGTWIGK